jgi:hypothetical protein
MALKNPRYSRHLAYLAYRLGGLPFRPFEIPIIWDHLWLEPQSDWARELERAVIEGQEFIKSCQALVEDLPGRLADAARETFTTHWENLKKHKCLPSNAERKAIADAVRAFWTALPAPVCDFAALRSAIDDVLTHTWSIIDEFEVVTIDGRRGWRRKTAPDERLVPAIFRLQTILAKMVEDHQVLIGLEVDLSLQAYEESGSKYRYLLWAKKKAKSVHRAIIERLRPPRSALEIVPTWIAAVEAQELAEDFKVPLSLSNISKLARKRPPLFDALTVRNRLYIRLDSFVKFLWERRKRARTGGATDEEAAEAIEQYKKQRGRPNLD